MKLRTMTLATALLIGASSAASAATVLASDFDDRVVSGSSVSNISWTTNGVSAPTDLSVVGEDFAGNPFGATFFDTTAARNRMAVNLNIENEGRWFIDINLNTLSENLGLTELTLDGFTYNNGGRLQTVGRELDFTASIIRTGDGTVLFNDEDDNVHLRDQNGAGGPFAVSFDLTSVFLSANTGYILRIGGNSDRRNRGNNGGFDNLSLTGETLVPVPLPAGGVLLLSAIGGLFVRRNLIYRLLGQN